MSIIPIADKFRLRRLKRDGLNGQRIPKPTGEFADLSPAERVKRYRELAEEARCRAERFTGSDRRDCFRIAEHWDQLAAVTERWLRDLAASRNPD